MTARAQAPKRVFLADHMLRDVVGHHLGYNLALADAAARAGVSPCLVAHRKFPLALAAGNACERIFRTDFRAAPAPWIASNHRLLGIQEAWCDRQFAADLRRFPEVGKSDAIFANSLFGATPIFTVKPRRSSISIRNFSANSKGGPYIR